MLAEDAFLLQLIPELFEQLILRVNKEAVSSIRLRRVPTDGDTRIAKTQDAGSGTGLLLTRTSCVIVMPHSRLKFSSSEGLGASWVFRGNLSPLRELDLLLRLDFRSRPDLSSSSGVGCLARFGDIVLSICLPVGILLYTPGDIHPA